MNEIFKDYCCENIQKIILDYKEQIEEAEKVLLCELIHQTQKHLSTLYMQQYKYPFNSRRFAAVMTMNKNEKEIMKFANILQIAKNKLEKYKNIK